MTRNTSARAFHVVRGDESTRIREEYSLYLENANVLFIIVTLHRRSSDTWWRMQESDRRNTKGQVVLFFLISNYQVCKYVRLVELFFCGSSGFSFLMRHSFSYRLKRSFIDENDDWIWCCFLGSTKIAFFERSRKRPRIFATQQISTSTSSDL